MTGRALIASLLLACTASCTGRCPMGVCEFTDQWSATNDLCEWDSWGQEPLTLYTLGVDGPLYPSEDCIDAVLADFSVDTDDLQWADGDDLYYFIEFYTVSIPDPAGTVLTAAWPTFAHDLGSVSDLQANEMISEEWIDLMDSVVDDTGLPGLGPAVYNFVTTIIERTTGPGTNPNPDVGAYFNTDQRRVVINERPVFGGIASLALFLHEVRHGYTDGHIECINPNTSSCDADIHGPIGFGMALLVQIYDHFPAGHDNNSFYGERWETEVLVDLMILRILSFQDYRGVVDEKWEDVDLAEY